MRLTAGSAQGMCAPWPLKRGGQHYSPGRAQCNLTRHFQPVCLVCHRAERELLGQVVCALNHLQFSLVSQLACRAAVLHPASTVCKGSMAGQAEQGACLVHPRPLRRALAVQVVLARNVAQDLPRWRQACQACALLWPGLQVLPTRNAQHGQCHAVGSCPHRVALAHVHLVINEPAGTGSYLVGMMCCPAHCCGSQRPASVTTGGALACMSLELTAAPVQSGSPAGPT